MEGNALQIIGNLPLFYLKVNPDGQIFRLVNGLVYQTTGKDEYLRFDGDCLRVKISYTGSIEDNQEARGLLKVGLDL